MKIDLLFYGVLRSLPLFFRIDKILWIAAGFCRFVPVYFDTPTSLRRFHVYRHF